MNLLKNLFILTFLFAFYIVSATKTVSISNSHLEVEINPFGAELWSIQDKKGNEYLWQGDPEYWGGRAPNMFPVNVRFKDERFTYNGKEYEMPRMGLAKISTFKIAEKQKDKVIFELKSDKATLKHYPFPFELQIIYQLKQNRLIKKFIVENTGSETMFFALGGHPGFRFPFENEREKNQYTFTEKFKLKRTEVANSLVQSNQIQWLNHENSLPLGDSRIPDGGMFVKNMPSRTIGVGVVGQPAYIELNLEDFPNVNIWSPPGMPFACIEPMVGHHDFQETELDIEKKSYLEKLEAGERAAYQFSIVIKNQNRTEVKTASELKTVVSKSKPGDLILLTGDDFEDIPLKLSGKGTKQNPIVIAAKKAGGFFVKNPIKIEGNYITLSGLTFVENGMLEIAGTGNRISNCKWDDSKQKKWLRILSGSSEIEIDHNTFQHKTSNKDFPRDCQLMQIVVLNKNERHHVHHNLFKDIRKGSGNGFETLQLITKGNPFDPPPGSCNTVIENNLFLRCNGESEIISVKSNGNFIRENTFRACQGALVLRHGDDNVAARNYFFGENVPGSGGVRIQGTGQVVASNYFQDLGNYGLGMMDGTPDDLYIRVENAKILFNTFVECENTFVIGINHSKHPNGTAPKNCLIEGNIFYSSKNQSGNFIEFIQNDKPEDWIWNGNIAFGRKIPEIKGIQYQNPFFEINEFYKPTSETQNFELTNEYPKIVKFDLFGNKWWSKRTAGAIQFPFEENKNQPLTEELVGAGF